MAGSRHAGMPGWAASGRGQAGAQEGQGRRVSGNPAKAAQQAAAEKDRAAAVEPGPSGGPPVRNRSTTKRSCGGARPARRRTSQTQYLKFDHPHHRRRERRRPARTAGGRTAPGPPGGCTRFLMVADPLRRGGARARGPGPGWGPGRAGRSSSAPCTPRAPGRHDPLAGQGWPPSGSPGHGRHRRPDAAGPGRGRRRRGAEPVLAARPAATPC